MPQALAAEPQPYVEECVARGLRLVNLLRALLDNAPDRELEFVGTEALSDFLRMVEHEMTDRTPI